MWNKFWLILGGQNFHFDYLGGFDFWFFGKFTLENINNFQKFKIQSCWNSQNGSFRYLRYDRNWFHAKSEMAVKFWNPHSEFPIILARSVFWPFEYFHFSVFRNDIKNGLLCHCPKLNGPFPSYATHWVKRL